MSIIWQNYIYKIYKRRGFISLHLEMFIVRYSNGIGQLFQFLINKYSDKLVFYLVSCYNYYSEFANMK